jgi:hypothetical protein
MTSELECCVTSPGTAKARACALASHAAAGFALEAAAGTSRHSRAPKERSLPPVQHSLVGPKQTVTSAALCARSKLECCASPESVS